MTQSSPSTYKGSSLFYALLRGALYILYVICFKFRFFGAERVPKATDSRGVIIAPNHVSFLDPPAVGMSLKRRVTFLAKDYLFKNGIVGIAMRGIGAYPIKSAKDDFRSIRDILRLLKDGKCVVIFPEGTRSENGELKSPGGGIGFLALKSHSWVVPAYIRGSYEAFPKGAKSFKCRPVDIFYGEPFVPAETEEILKDSDPYSATGRVIMSRIAHIRREVESGSYDHKKFSGAV